MSRRFGNSGVGDPDVSISTILMSSTSSEKTYGSCFLPDRSSAELSLNSMRPKVLSLDSPLTQHVELNVKQF